MKVGDKVWIPVRVIKTGSGATTIVNYGDAADFFADNRDIQTVTEEEYRNALDVFTEMTFEERREIWGVDFLKEAIKMTAEEFVGRLRMYRDAPKMGQIWKSSTGEKIVVIKADKSEVRYYRPCGNSSWFSRNYFDDNFINTGEVLTSIDAFLKDLEGLNEG